MKVCSTSILIVNEREKVGYVRGGKFPYREKSHCPKQLLGERSHVFSRGGDQRSLS